MNVDDYGLGFGLAYPKLEGKPMHPDDCGYSPGTPDWDRQMKAWRDWAIDWMKENAAK